MILPQADAQFRESPESLRLRLTGTGIGFYEKMIKQAKQNVPSGEFFLSDAKSFVPEQT
jgi:hypothetical protein